jgi:hypothetical protein
MSDIYQNALLNISADVGPDSNSGCFVNRNPSDITTFKFDALPLDRSYFLTSILRDAFQWSREAASWNRAWIYRERQLARRILHFTPTEVVWECCGIEGSGFASETFPGGAPFKNVFPGDNKFQTGRLRQGLKLSDEETYAVWNDTCEALSSKGLTKASDMPIIVSGIAKDLAGLLPDEGYIAGIWQSSLPASLTWTASPEEKQDKYVAPSWSWMSVRGSVTMTNRARVSKEVSVADVIGVSLWPSDNMPFGPLRCGVLELDGFLRKIQINLVDENKIHLARLRRRQQAANDRRE